MASSKRYALYAILTEQTLEVLVSLRLANFHKGLCCTLWMLTHLGLAEPLSTMVSPGSAEAVRQDPSGAGAQDNVGGTYGQEGADHGMD